MNRRPSLVVLQVNAFPWEWDRAVDGLRDGRETNPALMPSAGTPLSTPKAARRAPARRVLARRCFHFGFQQAGPDALYDTQDVDLAELKQALAGLDGAIGRRLLRLPDGARDLAQAGDILARLVLPRWVQDRLFDLPEGTPLVLRPDAAASSIPWELCWSPRAGRFLCQHVAMARGTSRLRAQSETEPILVASPEAVVIGRGKFVANPENDAALRPCAKHIEDLATRLGSRAPDFVHLHSNGVSWLQLVTAICDSSLFHYTGHIHFNPTEGSFIQLPREREILPAWRVGDLLHLRKAPAVVFLNGCRGDAAQPGATLPEQPATQASFVRAFYDAGVPAVLGSRWEIDLHTARDIQDFVYEQLADGTASLGEILRRYRNRAGQGLGEDARPLWPAYILYGNPSLRVVLAGEPERPGPRPALRDAAVPEPPLAPQAVAPQASQAQDAPEAPPVARPATEPSASALRDGPPALPKTSRRVATAEDPRLVVALVENSPALRGNPGAVRAAASFLRALASAAHLANASYDPTGRTRSCLLLADAFPDPLVGWPDGIKRPIRADFPWEDAFRASPGDEVRSLAESLRRTSALLRQDMAGHDLMPAPVVFILLWSAPGAEPPYTDDPLPASVALQGLALPRVERKTLAREVPAVYAEAAVRVLALGLGTAVPPQFLRELASSSPDKWPDVTRLFLPLQHPEDAPPLAPSLFRAILDPRHAESLECICRRVQEAAP